jgi:hypothetical protein
MADLAIGVTEVEVMETTSSHATKPGWAHEAQAVSLGSVKAVADAGSLADRLLVHETLARYAWAYDERRLDVLRDVFTEDGSYVALVPGVEPVGSEGRERLVPWLAEIMEGQRDQRRHVLANLVIEELTDTHCVAMCYSILFASDTEARLVAPGFYRAELRKEDGKWRIAQLRNGLDRPF